MWLSTRKRRRNTDAVGAEGVAQTAGDVPPLAPSAEQPASQGCLVASGPSTRACLLRQHNAEPKRAAADTVASAQPYLALVDAAAAPAATKRQRLSRASDAVVRPDTAQVPSAFGGDRQPGSAGRRRNNDWRNNSDCIRIDSDDNDDDDENNDGDAFGICREGASGASAVACHTDQSRAQRSAASRMAWLASNRPVRDCDLRANATEERLAVMANSKPDQLLRRCACDIDTERRCRALDYGPQEQLARDALALGVPRPTLFDWAHLRLAWAEGALTWADEDIPRKGAREPTRCNIQPTIASMAKAVEHAYWAAWFDWVTSDEPSRFDERLTPEGWSIVDRVGTLASCLRDSYDIMEKADAGETLWRPSAVALTASAVDAGAVPAAHHGRWAGGESQRTLAVRRFLLKRVLGRGQGQRPSSDWEHEDDEDDNNDVGGAEGTVGGGDSDSKQSNLEPMPGCLDRRKREVQANAAFMSLSDLRAWAFTPACQLVQRYDAELFVNGSAAPRFAATRSWLRLGDFALRPATVTPSALQAWNVARIPPAFSHPQELQPRSATVATAPAESFGSAAYDVIHTLGIAQVARMAKIEDGARALLRLEPQAAKERLEAAAFRRALDAYVDERIAERLPPVRLRVAARQHPLGQRQHAHHHPGLIKGRATAVIATAACDAEAKPQPSPSSEIARPEAKPSDDDDGNESGDGVESNKDKDAEWMRDVVGQCASLWRADAKWRFTRMVAIEWAVPLDGPHAWRLLGRLRPLAPPK